MGLPPSLRWDQVEVLLLLLLLPPVSNNEVPHLLQPVTEVLLLVRDSNSPTHLK